VRVDSGNHALHELLMSMLTNHAGLEILAGDAKEIFRVERILENSPDALLLTSRGNLNSDISNIRKARMAAPEVRIVMFGGTGAERDFLQYVRAGIRGCLLMGACAKDVWEALEAVQPGKPFVRARCAECCSIILSARRRVCLLERCGNSWV
jgi:DNA-binding NarL/FixJ family response regulator